MKRKHGRRAIWWVWPAVAAALLFAGLVIGAWRPVWSGRARVVIGLIDGRIEIAWGTVPISRAGVAWKVAVPSMTAHLVCAPSSSWRPSTSHASAAVGPAQAMTRYPVRVVYVPLWPWAGLFLAGAAGMWLWAPRRVKPGVCRGCGYDLAGLTGKTCPECGESIMKPWIKVAAALGMALVVPSSAFGRRTEPPKTIIEKEPLPRGATTAAYGISAFPTTLLIDREGKLVGRINVKETGAMEKAMGTK
jgi:hypothetical protein